MKNGFALFLILTVILFSACNNTGKGRFGKGEKVDTTYLTKMLDSVDVLYDKAEYEVSLTLSKQIQGWATELNDSDALSRALSIILCDYQQLGFQDSAITVARELLEIDQKRGDIESLSGDYQNLAYIYVVNKNLPLAKEFIEKGIEIEKTVKGQPRLATRYGLASEIHNMLAAEVQTADSVALREKSLDFANKAYTIEMEHKDTLRAGRRLSQKGDVLHSLKRNAEAIQAYKSAIAILEHYGERHSLAITYRQLGSVYMGQKNLVEAIPYLEKAKDLALDNHELYTLGKDYQRLYEAYKTIDEKKSTEYLRLYSEVKDSLYSLESAKSLSEFHAKYDTDKEKEKAEKRHRMLVGTWFLSSLGVIALIALAFMLYRRNRNNKLLKAQIAELKKQMAEQQQKYLEQVKEEEEQSPELNVKDKDFIDKVNETVFKLMGNTDLTTENIASELCITSQQLLRRIRSIKDTTAVAYVNSLRIGYAKQLLKERPDLSIMQVGHLCGFYEATHFARSFRKETGMTPTQFRES